MTETNQPAEAGHFPGVYWHPHTQQWVARIPDADGAGLHALGSFDCQGAAALAYLAAKAAREPEAPAAWYSSTLWRLATFYAAKQQTQHAATAEGREVN